MPRAGFIERGIALAYLQQADKATDPEWERMWLDMAQTRLLCAEGDETFNKEVMTLYATLKERCERLSVELGYRDNPASAILIASSVPSLLDIIAGRLAPSLAARLEGGETEAEIIQSLDPREQSRVIPRAMSLARQCVPLTQGGA